MIPIFSCAIYADRNNRKNCNNQKRRLHTPRRSTRKRSAEPEKKHSSRPVR